MGSYTFKINGVTQSLGVIKNITTTIKVDYDISESPTIGDAYITQLSYPYYIYNIEGIYTDTESNIYNLFLDDIIGAMQNHTQCTLQDRFGITKTVGIVVFRFEDIGGSPLKVGYSLTLVEGLV